VRESCDQRRVLLGDDLYGGKSASRGRERTVSVESTNDLVRQCPVPVGPGDQADRVVQGGGRGQQCRVGWRGSRDDPRLRRSS